VVEVLSPSTAEYDRGEKLEHYRQIPSLQEIVLVSHVKQELEVWRRTADGWHGETVGAGSAAMLGSSGCTLPVSKVYHDPLS
jgi:Uma2 family endonuclease